MHTEAGRAVYTGHTDTHGCTHTDTHTDTRTDTRTDTHTDTHGHAQHTLVQMV